KRPLVTSLAATFRKYTPGSKQQSYGTVELTSVLGSWETSMTIRGYIEGLNPNTKHFLRPHHSGRIEVACNGNQQKFITGDL
ncbi:hypothetical protein Ciccas_012057, partial [Cichlidogyrus casuarinus]